MQFIYIVLLFIKYKGVIFAFEISSLNINL